MSVLFILLGSPTHLNKERKSLIQGLAFGLRAPAPQTSAGDPSGCTELASSIILFECGPERGCQAHSWIWGSAPDLLPMCSSANSKQSDHAPGSRNDDTQEDGPRSNFRSLSDVRSSVSFWTNAIPSSLAVKTDLGLQEKSGFGIASLTERAFSVSRRYQDQSLPLASESDSPASPVHDDHSLAWERKLGPQSQKLDLFANFWKLVVRDKSHYH